MQGLRSSSVMVKRKDRDAGPPCDVPRVVEVQMVTPAAGGPGPHVFHFPSGYQPLEDSGCNWRLLSRKDGSSEHALVAETVRCGPLMLSIQADRDEEGRSALDHCAEGRVLYWQNIWRRQCWPPAMQAWINPHCPAELISSQSPWRSLRGCVRMPVAHCSSSAMHA